MKSWTTKGERSILRFLALNGKANRYEIKKGLERAKEIGEAEKDLTYQGIHSSMKKLIKNNLIRIVDESHAKSGGKKRIYALSILGLFTIIGLSNASLTQEKMNKIIENNKNKYFVFNEWNEISRNPEIKNHIINEIRIFINRYGYYYSTIYKTTVINDTLIDKKSERNLLMEQYELSDSIFITKTLTRKILGLDYLYIGLHKLKGSPPPYCLYYKTFDYFMKNPRLRSFIEKEIEYEDKRYKEIQKIKTIYSIPSSHP